MSSSLLLSSFGSSSFFVDLGRSFVDLGRCFVDDFLSNLVELLSISVELLSSLLNSVELCRVRVLGGGLLYP